MSSKEVGIEQARKNLGDLADAAHHHGEIAYLTRHGRPIAAIVPVNRVAKEPLMRTVYSTIDRVDPTVTREIADAVQEALENGHVERESYSSEDGQRDTWIRIVSFELDGQQRFAMAHEDPAEAEVIDSTDRAEIEALYEKQVRDLVTISEWEFDETDVALPYTLSIIEGDAGPAKGEDLSSDDSPIAYGDLDDETTDWLETNGFNAENPDRWVLVTPGGNEPNAANVIVSRDIAV